MAHHRLGKRDEASRAFAQARALRTRAAATQERGDTWKDILRATIAEAEARELLRGHPR